MTVFLLTFLSVTLAMLAGRDAVRIARFAQAGAAPGVLICLAILVAIVACAVAGWLAGTLAPLISSTYHAWLVGGALAFAAFEVTLFNAPAAPREPTRSLGALTLVLLSGVLADATGLIVIAFAVASGKPVIAAAGGALAAGGVLAAAALGGADWEKLPRRTLRLVSGAILLLTATMIVLFEPAAIV